jgi:hypothetical protein
MTSIIASTWANRLNTAVHPYVIRIFARLGAHPMVRVSHTRPTFRTEFHCLWIPVYLKPAGVVSAPVSLQFNTEFLRPLSITDNHGARRAQRKKYHKESG